MNLMWRKFHSSKNLTEVCLLHHPEMSLKNVKWSVDNSDIFVCNSYQMNEVYEMGDDILSHGFAP